MYYRKLIDLGFIKYTGSDSVYFDQYGYEYFYLVYEKDNISIEWGPSNSETFRCFDKEVFIKNLSFDEVCEFIESLETIQTFKFTDDVVDFKQTLLNQYYKHGNLIIAVDYDNTIRNWKTGEIIKPVFEILQKAKKLNCKLLLFTCREDRRLVEAIETCKQLNIEFDYINSSPILHGTRKPYFNILLDDKANLIESIKILNEVFVELSS